MSRTAELPVLGQRLGDAVIDCGDALLDVAQFVLTAWQFVVLQSRQTDLGLDDATTICRASYAGGNPSGRGQKQAGARGDA